MKPPVRIAVIDSGVHARHPHVNGVAGGVSIFPDGREEADFTDRLGHGTAVHRSRSLTTAPAWRCRIKAMKPGRFDSERARTATVLRPGRA